MDNICLGCGLCCDGTLYSTVELREDDAIEFLTAAGLRMRSVSGVPGFLQPCAASGGGCCAVYDKRPHVCREYRCELRVNYDAGTVSLTEAQRHIASAVALRDKLRPALEHLLETTSPQTLDRLCYLVIKKLDVMDGGTEQRRENADLLLDIGALSILLTRHFRRSDSEPLGTDKTEPMR